MWARRALKHQKRRFPARTVDAERSRVAEEGAAAKLKGDVVTGELALMADGSEDEEEELSSPMAKYIRMPTGMQVREGLGRLYSCTVSHGVPRGGRL